MEDVTLAHAKEHLEDLIKRAANGESVCIVSPRVGAVRLIPTQMPVQMPSRVILGQWKHLAEIPEERLLAPLTDDELDWLSGENSAVG
jgi:prevent-host-death family protein